MYLFINFGVVEIWEENKREGGRGKVFQFENIYIKDPIYTTLRTSTCKGNALI